MSGAEADRGQTRVDADKRVVVVRNAQFALVFGAIAVGVADQRSLPL